VCWVEGDFLACCAVRRGYGAGDGEKMRRCDSWDGNRVGHDDFKFSREDTNRSDDLRALKTSEHSVLQRTMRNYVPELEKNVKLTVVITMPPFGGCRESELPLILGTMHRMLGH